MNWTCKDGRVVSIRSMTDSHLNNAIRYLEREKPLMIEEVYYPSGLQGEYAQMAAENEFVRLTEMGVGSLRHAYEAMLKEAYARGLQ